MRDFSGYPLITKLKKETEFHLITLYLFWKLFKKYGNPNSLKKIIGFGTGAILFTLNNKKTLGVDGSFICIPRGKGKSMSYRLEYYTSTDPNFSENSRVDYFSVFSLSAGYVSSSGVDWHGFAGLKEQIKPQSYEISLNISGPKFESSKFFQEFKIEFFLTKIIKEEILPLEDWIAFKRKEALFPKKELA